MKTTVLLLAALCVMAAAPLHARGVDSIEWRDRPAWSCARRIAVRPFTMRDKDGQTSAPEEAMRAFVSELARRLEGHDGIEKVWLAGETDRLDADVVVTGVFVALGPTKKEGRANVHLRAYRLDEQSSVFELSASRDASLTTLDPNGSASIEAVATDIAAELLRKRGACNATELPPVSAPPPRPAPAPAPRPAPAPAAAPARVAPAPSAPLDATLAVESDVPGAGVTIDGRFAGSTPVAAYRLTAGTHTIDVSMHGYTTWQCELTVTSGTTTRVKAMLTR